jgi:4-amino-4-deoxy-L-arabinose transferase-like glycosyltransferase
MSSSISTSKKVLHLAVAGLYGGSLGTVFWMLTLPSGFISKRGVVLAAGVAVLLTFVFYKWLIPFFLRHRREYRFRGGLIVLLVVLLTGIAYQQVIRRPGLIFPFTPRQTLKLTLLSDSLAFRPLECDLVTIYASDFAATGNLVRESSDLMSLSGSGATLAWTGWPGQACAFTVVQPANDTALEVSWRGQSTSLNALAAAEEYQEDFTFPIPAYSRIVIAAILLLAVLALVFLLCCGYLKLTGAGKTTAQARQSEESGSKASRWVVTGAFVFLIAALFAILLYGENPYTHLPGRDQGVFLYIGNGLLSGQTPYLSAWDHKGPLVYFLNALGKLLDPTSEWGVVGLILLAVLATLLLMARLMRRRVRRVALLAGMGFFLAMGLFFSAMGNLVETYVVPLFALGLLAIDRAIEQTRPRAMLLFGVAGALAFCLRPNLISVFVVGGIAWLAYTRHNKRALFSGVLWALAGAIIVTLLVIAFFASRQALAALVDQMFRFNVLYSSSTGMTFWQKMTVYSNESLAIVLSGLLVVLFTTGISKKDAPRSHERLLFLFNAGFFLELILSRLSGLAFRHYSLPLLLIVTCLFILLVDFGLNLPSLQMRDKSRIVWQWIISAGLLIASVGGVLWLARQDYQKASAEYLESPAREWLMKRPTLLMWGAEAQVNYLLGVPAPTRFIYQYPLVNDAYCDATMGQEFLQDIQRDLPVIVDTTLSNPWMPLLDREKREAALKALHLYGELGCLQDFFDFFDASYVQAYYLPGMRWTVYLPREVSAALLPEN